MAECGAPGHARHESAAARAEDALVISLLNRASLYGSLHAALSENCGCRW